MRYTGIVHETIAESPPGIRKCPPGTYGGFAASWSSLSNCFLRVSQDIAVGFDKSGVDIDSITSIQRKASNNTWVVTFDSPVSRTAALSEQSITISGGVVFLGD